MADDADPFASIRSFNPFDSVHFTSIYVQFTSFQLEKGGEMGKLSRSFLGSALIAFSNATNMEVTNCNNLDTHPTAPLVSFWILYPLLWVLYPFNWILYPFYWTFHPFCWFCIHYIGFVLHFIGFFIHFVGFCIHFLDFVSTYLNFFSIFWIINPLF